MTLVSNRAGTSSRSVPQQSLSSPAVLDEERALDRDLDAVWRRSAGQDHLDRLVAAAELMRAEIPRLIRWADHLVDVLVLRGGRLLVAGNGGSAAEAQHLSSELVGKMRDDRMPLSAFALSAETSSVTAIANDYGYEQVFARQVAAHGRPGDVLILLTTSGRSPNLLAAADAAAELRMTTWALTGPSPNPLASRCDEALSVNSDSATAQELHLVAVHLLCAQVDAALPAVVGRGVR